jgi:hypothetical protein
MCSKWAPFFMFPYRKCTRVSFVPLHVIRSTHLIKLAHLISPVLLSEQNKLWSSSICSFLHSPLSSFFSGPNISLSTRLSTTLGLRSALGSSSGPGAYALDAPQPIGLLCNPCPPPRDFRRSHFSRQAPPRLNVARDLSSERWNCGRECWLVILPKYQLSGYI